MTLTAVLAWLDAAPEGTLVSAKAMRGMLDSIEAPTANTTPKASADVCTWRERIWIVPAETRLSVAEVAEGIGRPRSWVYRHTSEKSAGSDRLPCRKLDGELVFVAGEIRTWIHDHEEVITKGRSDRPSLSIAPRKAS